MSITATIHGPRVVLHDDNDRERSLDLTAAEAIYLLDIITEHREYLRDAERREVRTKQLQSLGVLLADADLPEPRTIASYEHADALEVELHSTGDVFTWAQRFALDVTSTPRTWGTPGYARAETTTGSGIRVVGPWGQVEEPDVAVAKAMNLAGESAAVSA